MFIRRRLENIQQVIPSSLFNLFNQNSINSSRAVRMSHSSTYEHKKQLAKESDKLEKFIDVHENTRRKVLEVDDIIGDLVEDFRSQRIKSDQEREREQKRIKDQHLQEQKERERMGSSAWYDHRAEQYKEKMKEKKNKNKILMILIMILT